MWTGANTGVTPLGASNKGQQFFWQPISQFCHLQGISWKGNRKDKESARSPHETVRALKAKTEILPKLFPAVASPVDGQILHLHMKSGPLVAVIFS